MMPLTFANTDEQNTILKISGNPQTKKHRENLGFDPGSSITIISSIGGDLIVRVKGARIAISREMAAKIMV